VKQPEFAALLAAQSVFYLSAYLGYLRKKQGKPSSLLSGPLHFCMMNAALLLGFFRYLNGHQKLTWNPTLRGVGPEATFHGAVRKPAISSLVNQNHGFKSSMPRDPQTTSESLGAL
jgi:hypothetical protein